MKDDKNKSQKSNKFTEEVVKSLVLKKEMKTAMALDADMKKFAKEKGIKIVMPL